MVEHKPKNDGFEDYTLGKDYGHFSAGSVLRVDPERRSWLDAHGYGKKSAEVSIRGGGGTSSPETSNPEPPASAPVRTKPSPSRRPRLETPPLSPAKEA